MEQATITLDINQCFCHMPGLMQRFQPSPISHSKPGARFLCLSPLSPTVYYYLLLSLGSR